MHLLNTVKIGKEKIYEVEIAKKSNKKFGR
jgi:hypothetical protein